MPSPLSHSAAAYALYRLSIAYAPPTRLQQFFPSVRLFFVWLAVTFLPDLDAGLGLATGDLERFHNQFTHSVFSGVIVALSIGCVVWILRKKGFADWFWITLVAYEIHILMDFFTAGRGVMAMWPLSDQRFEAPVQLFYGFHYSDGLLSSRHLITLVNEAGFVLFVSILLHVVLQHRKGRQDARVGGQASKSRFVPKDGVRTGP